VGMNESELRSVNNIPPRMQVRAGSSLLVLRSAQRDSDVSEYVADNARLSLQPETIARRSTAVRVRSGDTLSGLARRYGMSTASLAKLNNMSTRARLRVGQRIDVVASNRVVVTRESTLSSKRASSSRKSASSSKLRVKTTSAAKRSKNSRAGKSQRSSTQKTPSKLAAKKKK
jgi:membrane-bound lytic murein transglycosylase D